MTSRSIVLLVSLLAVLTGCRSNNRNFIPITGATIAPDAPLAIDVDNFYGNVRVIAETRTRKPIVRAKVSCMASWLRP